jgi:hypothetical protein
LKNGLNTFLYGITFHYVTSGHHIEVREEEKVFKHWSYVSYRESLYNEATKHGGDAERNLDLKRER